MSKLNYITAAEYGRRHGVSRQRVYVWAREGRLRGACELAGRLLIPATAPKPKPMKPRPRGKAKA